MTDKKQPKNRNARRPTSLPPNTSESAEDREPLPRLKDTEADIPTDRVKVSTPPAERFPPIPPRELPPEIEQSPNLYPHKQAPPEQARGRWLARFVFVLLGLAAVGAVVYVGYIMRNPYSALNPFVPPTPFPVVVTATFLPPTETPPPLTTPTDIIEPLGVVETEDPIEDPTMNNPYPFVRQTDVDYIANGNGRECEWSSIAGLVFDTNGEPINGLGVRITDQITQEENTVYTGSTATFGDGGFELPLGTSPEQNGYFVQLFSSAGAPLSEPVTVVTSERCSQNVAFVTFEQVQSY